MTSEFKTATTRKLNRIEDIKETFLFAYQKMLSDVKAKDVIGNEKPFFEFLKDEILEFLETKSLPDIDRAVYEYAHKVATLADGKYTVKTQITVSDLNELKTILNNTIDFKLKNFT